MKTTDKKYLYVYIIPAQTKDDTLEADKKPLKDRLKKIKSITPSKSYDNCYDFIFEDSTTYNDVYYVEKYNYYIEDSYIFENNPPHYLIISNNMNSIKKAFFTIMKEKIKCVKETNGSNWVLGNLQREFYSFKKQLSNSSYFKEYPEDFL